MDQAYEIRKAELVAEIMSQPKDPRTNAQKFDALQRLIDSHENRPQGFENPNYPESDARRYSLGQARQDAVVLQSYVWGDQLRAQQAKEAAEKAAADENTRITEATAAAAQQEAAVKRQLAGAYIGAPALFEANWPAMWATYCANDAERKVQEAYALKRASYGRM